MTRAFMASSLSRSAATSSRGSWESPSLSTTTRPRPWYDPANTLSVTWARAEAEADGRWGTNASPSMAATMALVSLERAMIVRGVPASRVTATRVVEPEPSGSSDTNWMAKSLSSSKRSSPTDPDPSSTMAMSRSRKSQYGGVGVGVGNTDVAVEVGSTVVLAAKDDEGRRVEVGRTVVEDGTRLAVEDGRSAHTRRRRNAGNSRLAWTSSFRSSMVT